jgi:hypothetical protein
MPPPIAQQMHNTTTTITAIITGVLLFFGPAGIGAGADDMSWFIISSPFDLNVCFFRVVMCLIIGNYT